MKILFFAIAGLLVTNFCFVLHIYQIRADGACIYNISDTAGLILENRTQDTLGFLFNKYINSITRSGCYYLPEEEVKQQ